MGPILLDLGFLQIRYYGLMYALALFICLYLTKRDLRSSNYKLKENQLESIILFSFFGGVLGGRVYYVLFNAKYYFAANVPWYEPFAIWHGGLAIHGGILGGIFAAWLVCKKYNFGLTAATDLVAPYILLGQAFGRFGNFMNGDAHGVPTDLAWGIIFPFGPASVEFPNQPTHPVMLYELGLNLLGFLLLFYLRKKKFRAGFLSASYFILYGIIRALVTNFRADDLYIGPLRAPHFFAIISILLAVLFIWYKKLYKRDNIIYSR